MRKKPIRIVIVDDEPLALDLLEGFVAETESVELIQKFMNSRDALEFMKSGDLDLMLLDIEMPGLTGMDLAKAKPDECALVFTTAYSEYASRAFELDAVDYLLKPFSYDRFLHAIEKAKEYLWLKEHKDDYQAAEATYQEKYLVIRTGAKLIRVPVTEIYFIEGLGEYVKVVCQGAKHVTLERMKNMEELLPSDNFMRVHKSYIVSLPQVRAIEGHTLELSSGDNIPISRDKKEEVMKMMFNG